MNIIWKKPDNTVAITSILDGSDPVQLAVQMQSNGDIPANWIVVATNHSQFPAGVQDSWLWNGSAIVSNPSYEQVISATPWQIRKALNQLGLRSAVESAVSSADQETQDGWKYADVFKSDNQLIKSLCQLLGKSDAERIALFQLAETL